MKKIMFGVVTLGVLAMYLYTAYKPGEIIARVASTDDREGTKLIYIDREPNMLRNDDDWVLLKWDSGNLQGQFIDGRCVRISYRGARFPMFSLIPNVVDAQRAKQHRCEPAVS